MWRPLNDDLSSPWVWRRSSPAIPVRPTRDSSLRVTRSPTVPPADSRAALDPRSLDPAALFGARLPSLFEVRRRLPTSATALRRAGNQTRALPILAGTKASTFFLFFSASRRLPCESGEAWRAALRPSMTAPVLVPPGYPGLPNRDASRDAPPPRLAPAEHSEDRRARVEGPSEGRVPSSLATISRARAGCIRLEARMQTTFPSSAPFGHPLSSARSSRRRNRCEGTGPT